LAFPTTLTPLRGINMNTYTSQHYYVYLYLRKDFTPYYVGKGKGQRIHDRNHSINLPSPERRIIIQDNLTELQSLILERYYIRWFGRKDNNTGILRNRTDGGDGVSGLMVTDETRNKLSAKMVGNTRNKGKVLSEEWKFNMSKSRTGLKREMTDKWLTHLSNMVKSRPMQPKIECPHCNRLIGGGMGNMNKHIRANHPS